MRTLLRLSIVAFATLIARNASAADLVASADTYTDTASATAATNYGSNGIIAVSQSRVAMIRFDQSAIARTPGGTATLSLKVLSVKNARDAVAIRLVREAWAERTVTSRNSPAFSALDLDTKILTRADEGKTVSFDVSAALAAWRADPAQNFGLAIVPLDPLPNLQFGAREMKIGAALSITGAPLQSESRLWMSLDIDPGAQTFTGTEIRLVAEDGTLLVRVTTPRFDNPLRNAGPLAADPITGGVWGLVPGGDVFRLGPTGETELLIPVQAGSLAADPRDGNLWLTTGPELLKYDRNGQMLVRVTGLQSAGEISLDDVSGTLWIGEGTGSVLRLSGSDAALNGYDASAPSGPHHSRHASSITPYSVAVNPNLDDQGKGNVWLTQFNPPLVVKLSASGTELSRRTPLPTNGFFATQLQVNRLTGEAAVLILNGVEGVAYFDASGEQSRFLRVFTPVADLSKLRYIARPGNIVGDPYRAYTWINVREFFNGDFTTFKGYLAAVDSRGHVVRHVNRSSDILGIARQAIRVSASLDSSNAVIDLAKTVALKVNVLSRSGFDALQVDPAKTHFGPGRASAQSFRAVDVNGDHVPDLQLVFRTADAGLRCSDRYAGLPSVTFGGIPAEGDVALQLTGCP